MKKENMKGSSGITLVALIITIIVLLILAVVAINSVNNTGIIQYAQNSADEYADGRDEENKIIGSYLDIIDQYAPKDKVLERIYYVVDGKWADKYVISESEVPENATITAKFYKTNTPYQPYLPKHWQGEVVPLKEGYAYKLVIDGVGDMPAIIDMNNGSAAAWGYEILASQDGDMENMILYLKDVEINGVSNVGAGAFTFLIGLENCYLGNSVNKIEIVAFHECGALQYINLENITYIGESAFHSTRSLKSVTLSQNNVVIKAHAFEYSGMENIYINSVTEIGEEAFYEGEANIKINKTADEIKAMANYPWGAEGKIYDKDNNLVYSR